MSLHSAVREFETGLKWLDPEERAAIITDIRAVLSVALHSKMSPELNESFEAALTLIAMEWKMRGKPSALAKLAEVLPTCPNVAAIAAGFVPGT